MDVLSLALMLLAAVLWGATDSLIKLFAPPQLKSRSAGGNVLPDFLALVQCPGYLACQGLNQIGSVLYYYTLALLSVVSPAVNTGKVIVNILVGRLVCGERLGYRKLLGVCLLTSGIILQTYPRTNEDK